MGSIGMDMTASTPSYVGGFNASIDGDGFFITKSQKIGGDDGVPANNFKDQDFEYTRVGQFLLDSQGYVVDANGNFVYGFRGVFVEGTPGTPAVSDDPNTPDVDESKPAVPGTPDSVKYETGLKPLRVPYVDTDGKYEVIDSEEEDDASASVTIEINNVGIISATVKYTDAAGKAATKVVTLGKVAIATFQNPNGVSKAGNSYYKATNIDNTGLSVAAAPGDAGTATLMGGFIESSNVDLAKEFSDMITTHRGFQANTKMITVSDEMLQDLVAMKR